MLGIGRSFVANAFAFGFFAGMARCVFPMLIVALCWNNSAYSIVVEDSIGFLEGPESPFGMVPGWDLGELPPVVYTLTLSATPETQDNSFHLLSFGQDDVHEVEIAPGIFFEVAGPSLEVINVSLGRPAYWYMVSEGDLFNEATIEAGLHTPLATQENLDFSNLPTPRLSIPTYGDFYLGVAAPPPWENEILFDIFGWAHMRITPDRVEMLESVVSYNDRRGIYVGGKEPIPGPPGVGLDGDYNNNGKVEQGDLDLVLLNWNVLQFSPLTIGWINDLPIDGIDQRELDGVLLNWGNSVEAVNAAAIPEPSTLILAILCIIVGMRKA